MLQPPPRLTCVEVRDRFKKRSYTKPVYVVAEDEDGNLIDMVMKVRHPDVPTGRGHYEGTSLACELICAMLARGLGMRVPDYAILEVRTPLGERARSAELRELLRRNIGENFGTVFIEGAQDWQPGPLDRRSTISDAVEGVLVFDSTVINGDRQQEKSNLLWDGQDIFLIDHSVALPVHRWDQGDIIASPLFPEEKVKEHCGYVSLQGHGRRFDGLLNAWRERISPDEIAQLRAAIPSSWEQRDGDLDRVFKFLEGREVRFDETSAHLRRIVR